MHFKDKEQVFEKIYGLLNSNGTFVLSIDKKQREYLECNGRKIKLYPDEKSTTHNLIKKKGFSNIDVTESEFAFIFSAKKI